MLISIITINLNNKKGLEDTILSVIPQLNKDIEYIIVDGLSIDGSVDVIRKYDNNFSKVIIEKDLGIYDAMNKGVKIAKNDWILFMNSGDKLISGSLQQISNLYLPNYDIIYGQNYSYSKGVLGKLVIKDWKWTLINFMEGCIPHQSTLTRRNVLLRFPFRQNYKLASCRIFFIETIIQNSIKYLYVPIPISIYDVDGQSSFQKKLLLDELEDYLIKYYGTLVYEDLYLLQKFRKLIQKRTLFDLLHFSSGRPRLKLLLDNSALCILFFLNKFYKKKG